MGKSLASNGPTLCSCTIKWSSEVSTSICLPIYGSTALVDLGRFFSFLIYTQSVGLLGRGDEPVARPLPTERTTQTQNKRTQTSMPRVAFEPTITVFQRAKTVHVSDRAATVIGRKLLRLLSSIPVLDSRKQELWATNAAIEIQTEYPPNSFLKWGPLSTSATKWPPIVSATDDRWVWSSRWNTNW
jgi:hypothetical protein